ncbi:MAG: ABC transporter ATP-binding protein [Acidobacteriota bacterium]
MHDDDHLRFTDLIRTFGRLRVLDGVSGTVSAGELLLVTGANGSGKSTLLRCLAGLLNPQSGEIVCRIDGEEVDIETRRRTVGWIAPDLAFYGVLSAIENLNFFAKLRGVDPARGSALLKRMGLPPGRAAAALSSGMRQRLRWAFALLHRPPILLLDEPLQNLDAPGRAVVLELLGEALDYGALAVVANPDPLEMPHVARRLTLGG